MNKNKQELKPTDNACERCGKLQKGNITFVIGGKREEDVTGWCMVEGTGRFVCPACYPHEKAKARAIIDSL